jgi:hypothetical protein
MTLTGSRLGGREDYEVLYLLRVYVPTLALYLSLEVFSIQDVYNKILLCRYYTIYHNIIVMSMSLSLKD